MVEPHDDAVLRSLKDVRLVNLPPPEGDPARTAYRLDFVFGHNDFFENEVWETVGLHAANSGWAASPIRRLGGLPCRVCFSLQDSVF
jgi:hypothetical protein